MSTYPNFELIEERFWNTYRPLLEKTLGTDKIYPKYSMECFEQTWGSSSTGFSGTVGCDVLTSEYTTIVHLSYSVKSELTRRFEYFYPDVHGVFFGNRLAYIVNHPNRLFYEDLRNRDMKPTGEMGTYLEKIDNEFDKVQGMELMGELEMDILEEDEQVSEQVDSELGKSEVQRMLRGKVQKKKNK